MNVMQTVEWELVREVKYSEKIRPSATWSTTNPMWPDLGSDTDGLDGKMAINVFYSDTVVLYILTLILFYIIDKTFGSEWWQA
jgi:hypothetical protein